MLVVIFLSTISYFFLDQLLSQYLFADHLYLFRRFNRHVTDIGEGAHFFIFAALAYLITSFMLYRSKKKFETSPNLEFYKKWSASFFKTLTTSGLFILILKALCGRQRPHRSSTFEANIWDPLTTHWHNHSFPSGHAQTLFIAAVYFSLLWPKYTKWFFVSAFLLSLTRIPTHNHFLSDVIIGSSIGLLVSLWILYYTKFSTIFSATRIPSQAADVMPPA